MNREETKEAIKVMQHYADGGSVEARLKGEDGAWRDCHTPGWHWNLHDYRIKPREIWGVEWRDGDVTLHGDRDGCKEAIKPLLPENGARVVRLEIVETYESPE